MSKTSLEDLRLLPTTSWSTDLGLHWTVGESQAHQRLDAFILNGLNGYHGGRDYPAQPHVSRLSPHLHFGELSPHCVWHRLRCERQATNGDHVDHFCRELGWREFSYYQLHYSPDLPTTPLNPTFDRFPWAHDDHALTCWQQGQTGIPIVDAGMRELWQTGYMHNRVRMITASFLVKNLRGARV